MTTQLFKNNAASTLASPVTVGGSSISLQVGHGSRFPTPTGSDYFLVTLFEKDGTGTEFNYEIVKVTARSGDVFTTISRDYEGTVGVGGGSAYPSAVGSNPSGVTYVQLRHTAYAAGNTLNKDGNLSGLASPSTALSNLGAEATANKDATGGYAGLTLYKINFKNAANTFTSWLTNANTAARTYTFKDADGTVAFTSDITGTNSGTNTGDETVTTDGGRIAGATAKTTPVDADSLGLSDSAASNVLKKLTWVNLKTTLGSLFATLAANTFTGAQIYSDQQHSRGMLIDMGTVFLDKGNSSTTAQTIDYTAGSHQKITVTGAFTLNAVTNWPPTGNLGEVLLELTNGASSVVTWPTINWVKSDGTFTTTFSSNGVTLQAAGTDFIMLWSRDAGATVYGKVMR